VGSTPVTTFGVARIPAEDLKDKELSIEMIAHPGPRDQMQIVGAQYVPAEDLFLVSYLRTTLPVGFQLLQGGLPHGK